MELNRIRESERNSHIELYSNEELYKEGSWLQKPIKTVTDLFPLFDGSREFRALDLGSGVGRNSIAIASRFQEFSCTVDCVDILELAIENCAKMRKDSVFPTVFMVLSVQLRIILLKKIHMI